MKKFLMILLMVALASSFAFADEEIQKDKETQIQSEELPTIKSGEACSIDEPCEKNAKKEKEKKQGKLSTFFTFLKPASVAPKRSMIDAEKYINLNKEQIKAAKLNRKEGEEKIKPYTDEIKLIEKKIKRIEFYNEPSEARDKQVERYLLEIKAIDKEADKIRQENQENFEKILTPEQLILFKKLTEAQKI